MQQEGVARFDRHFAALGRPNSNQRTLVSFEGRRANAPRASKVRLLLAHADDSVPMRFTRNHANAGKRAFDLPPLRCEREYTSQDLKLAIDRRDLHPGILSVPGIARDLFAGDGVEGLIRDGGVLQ